MHVFIYKYIHTYMHTYILTYLHAEIEAYIFTYTINKCKHKSNRNKIIHAYKHTHTNIREHTHI